MLLDNLVALVEALESPDQELTDEEKAILELLKELSEESKVASQVALLETLDLQHLHNILSNLFPPDTVGSKLVSFINSLRTIKPVSSQEFIF